MKLKPIKPKRISDQVFEQIRELIYKGEFKPGQQILPERELAVSMAVSRTSVRNAINKLVTMGLLEHRQGQGTFVSSPDSRKGNPLAAVMATEDATLDDLLEVRLGLEANAAVLAAQRASDNDVLAMERALEEMTESLDSKDRISTESDAAFHMAVAFASKNPVLIHLMRNFYDFLFIGIKKNLAHMYQDVDTLHDVLEHHKEVISAIRAHEPEKAGEAMREHMQYVKKYFRSR
ncbi:MULTISPECIES: FadR/GntR family transcriptional regulator [Desulfosediminicola]|uniref:FadR/GntR family transcriptional regulator n=1 Tax=Desulfosediminicola TaxID=2886823 RepID=UPI0010AC8105|nr:FadR/GntR family transcriptional regulator [Desulfosediminicola ganghwensis]